MLTDGSRSDRVDFASCSMICRWAWVCEMRAVRDALATPPKFQEAADAWRLRRLLAKCHRLMQERRDQSSMQMLSDFVTHAVFSWQHGSLGRTSRGRNRQHS